MPCFEAHQPPPPSSPPPGSVTSFLRCHLSDLTNPPPPHLPLQEASPPLRAPIYLPFLTTSPRSAPARDVLLLSAAPPSPLPHPSPPSSSPPESESPFVPVHVSELTNPLLPLPPLQRVSPRL